MVVSIQLLFNMTLQESIWADAVPQSGGTIPITRCHKKPYYVSYNGVIVCEQGGRLPCNSEIVELFHCVSTSLQVGIVGRSDLRMTLELQRDLSGLSYTLDWNL